MNKKGFSAIELLVLVIVVGIIGVGAMVYMNGAENSPVPFTPTPTIEANPEQPTAMPSPSNLTTYEYKDGDLGFSFEYPASINFDTDCCSISGPHMGFKKYSKTFAVSDTVMPNSDAPFDGFSIYIVELSRTQSFGQYTDMEKIKLTENHELMTGAPPVNPSEVSITVDGQTGIILRNYAWWVDDIIYIPHPDGTHVVVIPHMNVTDDFPSQFDQILDSFTFTNG